MPSHTNRPAVPATAGYRFLLRNREFAGLYAGFTLTAAASTLSGFALGTLVHDRTTIAAVSVAVTVASRPYVTRAHTGRGAKGGA